MSDEKPRIRTSADGMVSMDGLENVVSGLGTRADKRSANRFQFSTGYFNFAELEAAYSDNGIARKIVNIPVDDALREWREFQCEDAADIRLAEKRLNVRGNYSQARKWARLYGGGGILMITDQPLDEPLDVRKIGKDSLKRLVVLDRWELAPQVTNYHDPTAADYLMPEWYAIRGGQKAMIHSSHIVRVDGEDLPRRLRALNETWGDSKLRQVFEGLKDVTSTRGGIAAMVQEATVDVIKRDGLSDELANDQEGQIIKRYALAKQMQGIVNQLLLDGTEEYERKELSFSGLEGVLDKLMVWTSGEADIPMTRLFGQAPAGMDATGEGDMNNYYDALSGEQETKLRPELEQLDEVLVRSALGDMPDDCEWAWNPLYQESGTEKAQQELAYAQSEDMRINQGVLKPSHVMLRLKNQGTYAIDDDVIERQQEQEQAEENGEFDPQPGDEDLIPDNGDS
jgi:phage-related protein (TIGR01555 family)